MLIGQLEVVSSLNLLDLGEAPQLPSPPGGGTDVDDCSDVLQPTELLVFFAPHFRDGEQDREEK